MLIADRNRCVLICSAHRFKHALLQAFVEQPKTAAIPDQHLDAIATTVDKQVDMPGLRIVTEFAIHNAAQSVEAFAHITGMAVQIKM